MQHVPEFRGIFKKIFLYLALIYLCTGCGINYLLSSAYNQTKILYSREPIEKTLKKENLNPDTRKKLLLSQETKAFAEKELGLIKTSNYDTYVQLDRPYITYIISAAPIYELKAYQWSFPIVGKVPYKGYFSQEEAKAEAKNFSPEQYDTYVRGATAYSTLGWFDDPILSSMINYSEHELVNLIIHETVHATLYIKSQADFNERLATFIGNKGTEKFFIAKLGPQAEVLKTIQKENHDDKIFSEFITQEIKDLKAWYNDNTGKLDPELKKTRIEEIRHRFTKKIKPQMQTSSYDYFSKAMLNNAVLIGYQTYFYNMSDLEALFAKLNNDFKSLLEFCKKLEKSKDPEKEIQDFLKTN